MAEPGLQLEQGHRLLRVVQLGGDGGSGTVAGNASARILSLHTGFLAERRDQRLVQIARRDRSSAEAEEQRNGFGGFGINGVGLRWALGLPGNNRIANQRIH